MNTYFQNLIYLLNIVQKRSSIFKIYEIILYMQIDFVKVKEIIFCENIILLVILFKSCEACFATFSPDFIWSDLYISDIDCFLLILFEVIFIFQILKTFVGVKKKNWLSIGWKQVMKFGNSDIKGGPYCTMQRAMVVQR